MPEENYSHEPVSLRSDDFPEIEDPAERNICDSCQ